MKLDKLNQWLVLGANIGVIVGIIFLAQEVAQNNLMMKAQTRNAIAQETSDILFERIVTRDLAEVMIKGMNGEELDAIDNVRFRSIQSAQFRHFENIYYQYKLGLYDELEYEAQLRAWKIVIFTQKGGINVWCTSHDAYSEDFAAEMDKLLPSGKCK